MRAIATVLLAAGLAMGSATAQQPATPVSRTTGLTPDGCVPAKLVKSVPPVYPQDLKGSGVGGAVTVQGTIGTDGKMKDVAAVSGPDKLRQPAVDAVSQWLFEPSTKDGTPVEMKTNLTVTFQPLDAGGQ
jgi:TonB family protein